MAFEPWYKASLSLSIFEKKLSFAVPHDVFSTLRIDEGTLLLLEHLPEGNPASILDMGCGYGALGLPVAVKYPQATLEMVDRDLLAVEWANKNAQANELKNIFAYPSLGYRDIRQSSYNWILCNVPARIGRPFIENLFEKGNALLSVKGELRVVVIRDLGPILKNIAQENNWPIEEIARGPKHIIFQLKKTEQLAGSLQATNEKLYTYDEVTVKSGTHEIQLKRPFDISGDTTRLNQALPVLLDVLPRKAPKSVFVFRCGYGALPLLSKKLWPDSQVVACDRDLLAVTFARENANRLGLGESRLEFREGVDLTKSLKENEFFDFLMGEISPSAGEKVLECELLTLVKHLNKGGQCFLLTIEKIEREWIAPIAKRQRLNITRLLERNGNVVLRLS